MRVLRRLIAALALTSTTFPALAQPVFDVPGFWNLNTESRPYLSLKLEETDLHPFFLFGLCKETERFRIADFSRFRVFDFSLDVDPRLYGDAVSGGGSITVGYGTGSPSGGLGVVIEPNEMGPWSLRLSVDEETLLRWRDAPELMLSLVVYVDYKTEVRQHFRLPDESRREAIGAFIQACFHQKR